MGRVARWYIFKPQKQFGYIFDGLVMDGIGIYLTNWSILPPFDIFCGHLIYFIAIWSLFPRSAMMCQGKSGKLTYGS
jgi:hypothetical protein